MQAVVVVVVILFIIKWIYRPKDFYSNILFNGTGKSTKGIVNIDPFCFNEKNKVCFFFVSNDKFVKKINKR